MANSVATSGRWILAIINAGAQLARERFSAAAGKTQIPLRQGAAAGRAAGVEAMREGLRKMIQRIGEMIRVATVSG